MIKATELKIGNLIKVGKKIAKVNGSLLDYCDTKTEVPEFYPIPLTPEILDKAGFERWSDNKTFEKIFNDDVLQIMGNEAAFGGSDSPAEGQFFHAPIKLQYVHQLQNLYFALTGEELEINL